MHQVCVVDEGQVMAGILEVERLSAGGEDGLQSIGRFGDPLHHRLLETRQPRGKGLVLFSEERLHLLPGDHRDPSR